MGTLDQKLQHLNGRIDHIQCQQKHERIIIKSVVRLVFASELWVGCWTCRWTGFCLMLSLLLHSMRGREEGHQGDKRDNRQADDLHLWIWTKYPRNIPFYRVSIKCCFSAGNVAVVNFVMLKKPVFPISEKSIQAGQTCEWGDCSPEGWNVSKGKTSRFRFCQHDSELPQVSACPDKQPVFANKYNWWQRLAWSI